MADRSSSSSDSGDGGDCLARYAVLLGGVAADAARAARCVAQLEEVARCQLAVQMASHFAAVQIQSAFRRVRAHRAYRRVRALLVVAAVGRGFAARRSVARLKDAAGSLRLRLALQQGGERGSLTVNSNSRDQDVELARPVLPRANTRAITSGADAAHLIQRWVRRLMPVVRARYRARRVRVVVRAAVAIQRTWRGFRARRAFAAQLRCRRWTRQLHGLARLLDRVATAPEARALRKALRSDYTGVSSGHDWGELDGADIDPEADAAYFRGLGGTSPGRALQRPVVGPRAAFLTGSVSRVNEMLAVAERDAEAAAAADATMRAHRELQARRRSRAARAGRPSTAATQIPEKTTAATRRSVVDRLFYGQWSTANVYD